MRGLWAALRGLYLSPAQMNRMMTTMLMLVRGDNGRLRFFTHAARPEPRAGDTIITFTPPKTSAAPEKADDAKPGDGAAARPQAT